ncbi:carbohydrate ABC transporter permease [Paenibacillus eucommiae]|uniref:Multiple sugar transport system permease protein n=1 Tax=Paenibacillus eucommiae TaxID=1355755 RepID=A0ABS4INI6_9BACL|nr:carbohydrate ABC transporter permease [Paenibacillus eucommiae]MBP1989138.1 multiple sugar transport system permease protein [Paenibacillus eucommiae]
MMHAAYPNQAKPKSARFSRKAISSVTFYVGLLLILGVICFPFLWMILASLKTQVQIMSMDQLFVFSPILNNYQTVFGQYEFVKPIMNSLIIGVASTLLAILLGLPAAYAISRYKQNMLGLIILMVRFIPGITFLIPWYIIFSKMGLVDTHFALSLSHLLINLPFIIWIMIPYFDSLPKELEEAAIVDGSSIVGLFLRIIVPLSVPGIITASLLSFIFSWNNLVFSMALAGGKTQTLPLAIFNFISYAAIDWGALMAAAVLITIPILILSLTSQRFIMQGLTAGAVKG